MPPILLPSLIPSFLPSFLPSLVLSWSAGINFIRKGVLLVTALLSVTLGIFAVAYFSSPITALDIEDTPNRGLTGEFVNNNRLADIELITGLGRGPEAITFRNDSTFYTGLEDGRILSVNIDTGETLEIVNTFGRPLGMKFDAQHYLIVADAVKGLLRIDALGGIEVLVSPELVNFADDLDIASDGTIWFTDATAKHTFHNSVDSLLEGDRTGRLLSYEPHSKKLQVHLDGIYFANGVVVSENNDYVLVSETGYGRILKVMPSSTVAVPQFEMFYEGLPFHTDNITFNGRDTIWVAGPAPRSNDVGESPMLRQFLSGLPRSWWQPHDTTGAVLGINLDGKLTHNLQYAPEQSSNAELYTDITSVIEHKGKLYIGSLVKPEVAVLPLVGQ